MENKQPSLPRNEIESVFSLYLSGDFELAIDQIKTLNQKYPNEPLLFNLIGACYKEIGQLEVAAKMFKAAVSIQPVYAEAHFNLGVTYQDLEDLVAAVDSYKKAIEITPNYPDALNNLGTTFYELKQLENSIESLESAVAYKNVFPEAQNNLGRSLHDYGKVSAAIKAFGQAIKYNPDYSKAYLNLAVSLKTLGDKENAIKNIEKALILNPNWSNAHLELIRLKKYKKDDERIDKIHALLEMSDISVKDRINFNFVLAKFYEDLENYDEQFKYLNEANSLRKKEVNYFFAKDQKLFARIKETFNMPPTALSKSLCKTDALKPIFILGMPRSGTSLVHQIIGSHKQVYGAGELNALYQSVIPCLKGFENKKSFSEEDLIFVRKNYLDSLKSLNCSEKIILDKMPLNFRYIGFILTAIPEAKILHMNRDPMATCWSIYKYYFPGNYYSYNQEDIASYYGLYKNLMSFWHELFPNKIYDVSYEDLTINQEGETRELLKYCELQWDDNCLNFHKNKASVRTTSSIQVKQKMYQGSSEAWKKYSDHLQPLVQGLNY